MKTHYLLLLPVLYLSSAQATDIKLDTMTYLQHKLPATTPSIFVWNQQHQPRGYAIGAKWLDKLPELLSDTTSKTTLTQNDLSMFRYLYNQLPSENQEKNGQVTIVLIGVDQQLGHCEACFKAESKLEVMAKKHHFNLITMYLSSASK